MTDLLTESKQEAASADPTADEAARIAWLARRREVALGIAESEALRESARRGRPVYWRARRVTLPPEWANPLTGDRTYTVNCPTGQRADAEAGNRYSGERLLALSQRAASIAAGKSRKRGGFSLSEAEREAIAAEVALAALETHPDGLPKGADPADDLAYLAATAERIIAHGGDDRRDADGHWRDSSHGLPWGSAAGEGMTLADVVTDTDVTLAGEQGAAESDPYLAPLRQVADATGAPASSPLSHCDALALAMTGTGKAERRCLAAALSDAPSSDWLRAEGVAPDRKARRNWRQSRDRGAAALRKRIAKHGAARVAALVGQRRDPAESISAPGISASVAAKAYATARKADTPSPEWTARELVLRSCVMTPNGPALRQRRSHTPRTGQFASPTGQRWQVAK